MDSSFLFYLQHINNIPLLSHEEERETATKALSGDPVAKEKLITANLRFVVKIAKRYVNKGIPLSDLVSEGNLGLIRATETFDPKRGYHFISYAVHWIKQSIVKSIAEKSKPLRLPLSWNNKLVQMGRYFNNYVTDDKHSDQKVKALAKGLNMKEHEIIRLLQISQNSVSLDQTVYMQNSEDAIDIKNTISNKESLSPEDIVDQHYFRAQFYELMQGLKPMERDIIERRFALGKFRNVQTLHEVGAAYKLTKERVRQIEKKTLDALRQKLSKEEIVLS